MRTTVGRSGQRLRTSATAGRCKFCRCTESRACSIGCAWIDPERNVCTTCSMFRDVSVKEAKAVVEAMGFDFDFDGIVCASAAIEGLRLAGYDIVRLVGEHVSSGATVKNLRASGYDVVQPVGWNETAVRVPTSRFRVNAEDRPAPRRRRVASRA